MKLKTQLNLCITGSAVLTPTMAGFHSGRQVV